MRISLILISALIMARRSDSWKREGTTNKHRKSTAGSRSPSTSRKLTTHSLPAPRIDYAGTENLSTRQPTFPGSKNYDAAEDFISEIEQTVQLDEMKPQMAFNDIEDRFYQHVHSSVSDLENSVLTTINMVDTVFQLLDVQTSKRAYMTPKSNKTVNVPPRDNSEGLKYTLCLVMGKNADLDDNCTSNGFFISESWVATSCRKMKMLQEKFGSKNIIVQPQNGDPFVVVTTICHPFCDNIEFDVALIEVKRSATDDDTRIGIKVKRPMYLELDDAGIRPAVSDVELTMGLHETKEGRKLFKSVHWRDGKQLYHVYQGDIVNCQIVSGTPKLNFGGTVTMMIPYDEYSKCGHDPRKLVKMNRIREWALHTIGEMN